MAKKKTFISEFLKDRREVGAVAPSSKSLGRKICSYVDFDKADIILELGPGNGVFTKLILERMKPSAKLFAFETNRSFCDIMEAGIDDSRLVLINDSAEKITEYLEKNGCSEVDYVVSSLPYTVFPKVLKNKILDECVHVMKKDASYIQFQYSLNARSLLKSKFDNVIYTFSLLNVPPAFVYRCTFNSAN